MRTLFKPTLAALALGAAMLAPAHAAIIYGTGSNTASIAGVSSTSATGATISGSSITATFGGGLSETVSWADLGGDSGGVTGTDWSLTLNGDSAISDWLFTNDTGQQLTTLVLDGRSGLTVFDRAGGASGGDWVCRSGTLCDTANVVYDYIVGIGADLAQVVSIDFGTDGPDDDFSFNQPALLAVPEPATLALIGAGLALVAGTRRRSN